MGASESEQAWLFAAKVGEAAQLQQLLAAEPHLLAFAGAGTPDQVIGNTATHWAASKGHVAALEVLLRAGADVHARNNGDSTPLHCAALSNQLDCAGVLLQHGADAALQDEFGDSPLSLAQRADGRDALVALLLGKRGSAAAAPSPSAAECRQWGNDAFKAERYEEANPNPNPNPNPNSKPNPDPNPKPYPDPNPNSNPSPSPNPGPSPNPSPKPKPDQV